MVLVLFCAVCVSSMFHHHHYWYCNYYNNILIIHASVIQAYLSLSHGIYYYIVIKILQNEIFLQLWWST